MKSTTRMNAVFLANFSDSCFRAIPAIAQMADELSLDLTLLHVYDSATSSKEKAEALLASFFPEADLYPGAQRLCVPGPLLKAVRRLDQVHHLDLIIAPSSDVLALPRPFHRSLRRALLHEFNVPIWTFSAQAINIGKPTKNIAFWWEAGERHATALAQATEYAAQVKATLHILYTLPDLQEGSIAPLGGALNTQPFPPIVPQDFSVPVKIHVGHGEGHGVLRGMIDKTEADLLIQPWREGVMDRLLHWRDVCHGIPCPVLYLGHKHTGRRWNVRSGNGSRVEAGLELLPSR
jgi:hypothetical protein